MTLTTQIFAVYMYVQHNSLVLVEVHREKNLEVGAPASCSLADGNNMKGTALYEKRTLSSVGPYLGQIWGKSGESLGNPG